MKPPKIRARWHANDPRSAKIDHFMTRYYDTPEEAQDHLMKAIGHFNYLGRVAGDAFSNDTMRCEAAPRNGGLVTLEWK